MRLAFAILLLIAPGASASVDSTAFDLGNLRYSDLVRAAASADYLIVWEGLPGPFETEARAHELSTKHTFQLGGEDFYVQPMIFTDPEKASLSDAVLKHRENFKAWSGFKFCGGFHADYALEWRSKGKLQAQVLLCFSCHEAHFLVSDKMKQVDLSEAGFKQFVALLGSHHQERPAFHPSTKASTNPPKMVLPKIEDSGPPPILPPPPATTELPTPEGK